VSESAVRQEKPRRRRRWTIAAAGLLVAAVAPPAATIGRGARDAGEQRRQPPPATARVTRLTLVEEQTLKGSLGYGEALPLSGRLPGTLTWLPPVGAVLGRGDVAYRVDNQPIVVMIGNTPAFRALAANVKGPDVAQLEKNLQALGYTGFTVDDSFTSATAAAVKRWQKDHGLARTGTVELGRVIFCRTPQRVDEPKLRTGVPVATEAVYDTTSTVRSVVIDLEAKHQSLVRKDGKVTVLLADGRTTPGAISEVDSTGNQGKEGGDGGTSKVKVTVEISDQKALKDEKEGPIDVRLTARERENVLTVPIVALLALENGGYGVEVVDGPLTRIAPVEIGLFAAGRVEISGPDIAEGTEVGVPAP
jgi:multidrug efflux system membrane fusion protein